MAMANLSIAPTAISPRATPIRISLPPDNAAKCIGAVAASRNRAGQTPAAMSAAAPAPAQASGHDGGVDPAADAGVEVRGCDGHHRHLLAAAAGATSAWQGDAAGGGHHGG